MFCTFTLYSVFKQFVLTWIWFFQDATCRGLFPRDKPYSTAKCSESSYNTAYKTTTLSFPTWSWSLSRHQECFLSLPLIRSSPKYSNRVKKGRGKTRRPDSARLSRAPTCLSCVCQPNPTWLSSCPCPIQLNLMWTCLNICLFIGRAIVFCRLTTLYACYGPWRPTTVSKKYIVSQHCV